MDYVLLLAGILMFFIGIVHSLLGERRLIGPLLAPDKRSGLLAQSSYSRSVLRYAWHMTTIVFWGFAAILVTLSIVTPTPGIRPILIVIATTFLLSGLLALGISRGRHVAWPLFLAVAGLCYFSFLQN